LLSVFLGDVMRHTNSAESRRWPAAVAPAAFLFHGADVVETHSDNLLEKKE
jgi:hypothetical protein